MQPQVINQSHLYGELSDMSGLVVNTMRSVHDRLWREISDMAGLHQESMAAATDRLISEAQETCNVEQRTLEEIRRLLVDDVGRLITLLGNCQSSVDDHNRKLAKKEANRQSQARRRARQQMPADGNSQGTGELFPPPPSPMALTGNFMRVGDGDDQLALDQFTPDMWSVDSTTGLFWSVQPTPFSRASIAVYTDGGSTVEPTGEIYLNTNVELPDSDMLQIITDLGFRTADVNAASHEDAYYSAVQQWGQVAVDNLYDQRGMTTYARRATDVPRLRDVTGNAAQFGVLPNVPAQPIVEVPVGTSQHGMGANAPSEIRLGRIDGESDEHYRERVIFAVNKLIEQGVIPPERRGEFEQFWLVGGQQQAAPGNGEQQQRQVLPPSGPELPSVSGRLSADCTISDVVLSLARGTGGDCSIDLCKLVDRVAIFFGMPPGKLPPCVSASSLLRTDPTS